MPFNARSTPIPANIERIAAGSSSEHPGEC